MRNIKISVIIPVYGVEKYIRQCLESVINQSYKNLEIIVVNDGTKDNSMKIVEEYLEDKRIKVINKENGGLSSARNRGIEEATGEYISFVDSDDWINLDLYRKIVENIKDEDVLIFDILEYDEIQKKFKEETMIKNKKDIKKYNKGYLFYLETQYACWNKIYKREYLKKLKINFIEAIIYEDVCWSMKTLFLTNNIKFLDFIGYYYRINREGSIIYETKIFKKNLLKEEYSVKKIYNEIRNFVKDEIQEKGAILLGKLEEEKWKNYFGNNKNYELDKTLKFYFSSNLNIVEKNRIRREVKNILKVLEIETDINIFKYFYIKNRFINWKIIRREFKRRWKCLKR